MKKLWATALTLAIAVSLTPLGYAATEQVGSKSSAAVVAQAELTNTTVTRAEDSQTGYVVTFCCNAPEAKRVRLKGSFSFTDYAHASLKTSLNASPYEWQDGMFNYGDDFYCEMTKDETSGVWMVTLPLPGGTYSYNFYIDGEATEVSDVSDAVKVDDPAHPCLVTGYETNPGIGSSTIYVPRDDEKQAKSIDLTLEAPREDGQVGTYFFESIQYKETTVPYGVYLPAGFNAEREEPYPILLMLHGGGGSEGNWFNDGLTHIMDNLIADNGLEDTIVITPNWTIIDRSKTAEAMETAYDCFVNTLLPTIVEKYNGAQDAEHRAIAGLSQGGARVMYMLYNHPDMAKYFFGYSCPWDTEPHGTPELNAETYADKVIFIGCGLYDFVKVDCYLSVGSNRYETEQSFYKHVYTLNEAGISFNACYEPTYGHSWQTWRELAIESIGNYLWK